MTQGVELKDIEGKSINEVRKIAEEKIQAAQKGLLEAAQIYAICAKQKVDAYARGQLIQRHWEIEHLRGNQPLFMSQAGQDKFIYERFFGNKRHGVFVEIGGFNGWQGSNCYFFEKLLGWTGVIVEASPSKVREISRFRNCQVIHAAIADQDGEADFLDVISGYTQTGGLLSSYPEAILKQVRANPNHKEEIVKVPTLRFDSLLERSGISRIDYCSIDVEGGEKAILQTIDFQKVDISVISLENGSGKESEGYRSMLEPFGYKLIDVIGVDEIYSKI